MARTVTTDRYMDPITGDWVDYVVSVPEIALDSYALIVNLHSCHREPMSLEKCIEIGLMEMALWRSITGLQEYIILHPTGFGNSLFVGMGERDVINCLSDIKSKYPIDIQRIFLVGFSMGGAGALYLASKMPHLFCGVVSISGYTDTRLWNGPNRVQPSEAELREIEKREAIYSVDNLRYTNLYIAHGKWDLGVGGGVAFSQHEKLIEKLTDKDITYTDMIYEQLSHSEFPVEKRNDVVSWVRKQKKKNLPKGFSFIVTSLRHNEFYSIKVTQLTDYSRNGVVSGMFTEGRLNIVTENIEGIHVADFNKVKINGQETSEIISSSRRREGSAGSISDSIFTRMLFCYDSACSDRFSQLFQEEIANAECRFLKSLNGGVSCGPFRDGSCYYQHKAIPFSEIPETTINHTLVVYGVLETNALVKECLEIAGISIDERGITLSAKVRLKGQLGIRFILPREEGGYIITNTATHERLIAQGFGIWYGTLPDYIVYDFEKIVHYGYFNADWRFSEETFFGVN